LGSLSTYCWQSGKPHISISYCLGVQKRKKLWGEFEDRENFSASVPINCFQDYNDERKK
jgi:hypothetical protein